MNSKSAVNKSSWGRLTLLAVAAMMSACGGGEEAGGSQSSAVAAAPAAGARMRVLATTEANGLTGAEAAGQLMNFAEQGEFKSYFPGHPATLQDAPFIYRYYADTKTYLGVAVGNISPYLDGHVYVMGGTEWQGAPVDAGLLSRFISPTAAFSGVWTGQYVNGVGGASVKVHAIARPGGEFMMFAEQNCHVFDGSYYTNASAVVYSSQAHWTSHCYGATEQAPRGWDGSGSTDRQIKQITGGGTALARSSTTLSYRSSLPGDTGSIQLAYSALHERGSSLDKLAGSYVVSHPGTSGTFDSGTVASITIAADGSIVGTETGSHQPATGSLQLVKRSYTGQISLIDPTRNLYQLSINVDGVAMTGYAFTADSAVGKTDDAIQLVALQSAGGAFVHRWVRK